MILSTTIKRVFLSFAQKLFLDLHPLNLVWNVDPRKTKIFIADNYSVSPQVVEKMPAIILVRGSTAWANTSIDQRLSMDMLTTFKLRKDLVRASITFQCTSKNGIEAEGVADTLFTNLVGYKDQFRKNGIHQILAISMGEERLVRGDAVERLFSVPITVMFAVESEIAYVVDEHILTITSASGISYLQQVDYTATASGLDFYLPPLSGIALTAEYLNAITLQTITETLGGIADGVNTRFTLTGPVYGYNTLFEHFVETFTTSGLWVDA